MAQGNQPTRGTQAENKNTLTGISIVANADEIERLPSLSRDGRLDASSAGLPLPSFPLGDFETFIKGQQDKFPHTPKAVDIPPLYPSIENECEFPGWGTLSCLDLSPEEMVAATERMSYKPSTVGQLRGTGLPGNSMTSSVFYAFPAVVAVSSIFSPLALLIACLILFLWRPIFLELGSAIRLNGGNYAYLLQVSGTSFAFVGAAVTLLDSVATSTESAATAASYLKGEVTSPSAVSEAAVTVGLLAGLAVLCLVNVRRSSTLTLSFFLFHLLIMAILMIASVVTWARQGSDVLVFNWGLRPRGTSGVAKAIFNGVCIGFLGVTGFETTPTYIEAIHPNAYGPVLRNILICTLALNAPLILLVYAVLPSQTITGGTNILSILAEVVAGKWLRTLVVVDCVLVLAGGVIDGICAACATLERLAKDQVFSSVLLKTLPIFGSPYISIVVCFALNILLYTSSAFSLQTISGVFTVTFLSTLLLFILSDLLLKLNRNRLPSSRHASFLVIFLTLALDITLLVGNITQDPKILGLFAIYFVVTSLPFLATRATDPFARILMWFYDRTKLRNSRWTTSWDMKIVGLIKRARRHPICVWIHDLLEFILYVRKNEITSHIIFVHAYQHLNSIPQELASNIKTLDEAFPSITLDLMLVQGTFGPPLVEAVSAKRNIPRSKMFMSCPGKDHGWELGEYQGVRVVTRY